MLYIQIPNFSRKHSNTSTYKTLRKSGILKVVRKESIFLYSNRHNLQFFLPVGVFTS